MLVSRTMIGSVSEQEWARRQLEGSVLAYLRLGSKKRGSLAVHGMDRWFRVCGVPEITRWHTVERAIAKSPHRDSPEAHNLVNHFLK